MLLVQRYRDSRRIQPNGFTLVELLAVVVLISILSATAAVMVRLPLAKAQREHSLAQFRSLDSIARDRAARGQKVALEIDIVEKTARLIDRQRRELVAPVILGGHSDSVTVIGGDSKAGKKRQLRFDHFGTSESYALRVGRSEGSDGWLVVLGMTGQTYSIEERRTVDAIINRQRRHSR